VSQLPRLPSAKWIETSATAALAVCAVIVTGILLHREFSRPTPHRPKPVFVKDWQKYATGDERIGSGSGRVKVIVFSDFECPFCRQLSVNLEELIEKSPSMFEIIHRNYPLSGIHPYARAAAIAGECAAAQDRFGAFYQFVFAHQDSLRMFRWSDVARRTGVQDTTAFRTCISDSTGIRRLYADSVAAVALNIKGTPTVMVNGWKVGGSPPPDELEGLIARALKAEEKK
jgi:protein-disulfide isomerase